MNIVVNTRLLLANKLDGIGWFSFETLKRICQNHPNDKFIFLFDRNYSKEFIFSDNIEPMVVGPPTRHPILWYYWFELKLPVLLKKLNPDLFLSPDGYLSLKSQAKSLAVIHDLNFVHYPNDLPLTSRLYYNYFFKRYAAKANRLVTVSEFSKQDIVASYGINPEKIDVVYNGSNLIYHPLSKMEQDEVKQNLTGGLDYFLFIGSLHPRKNIANMLKAFEKFSLSHHTKVKFLIIGQRFFKTGDIQETLESMKFKDDVQFLGHLSPSEISKILAAAIALVLVSKFEGFGIPVIEAFKCDIPVIVSNATSLPEVAQNAALYADPFSVNSICDAMSQMANNESIRNDLIEKGRTVSKRFSWDKTAGLLWDSILKTVEKNY